jgi:hypothetical protein
MAKVDKKIRDPKIQDCIDSIRAAYQASGQKITPSIIEDMKAMREHFIVHNQPTIVKSIRLAYEHLEKFGDFVIEYHNDEEPDEDGEGEEIELPVPIFEYYIGLLSNPTNKYNRDEIKEINILLKDSMEDRPSSDEEEEDGEDQE